MTDDPFEAVLAHLTVTSRKGDKAEAICPAHEDRTASLSVARGDDVPVILHCHAGDSPEAVCKALGLTMADLMGTTSPHRVAAYAYTDQVGNALYWVERWVPKTFRPRLLSGAYERVRPVEEVLYNLPGIAWARANGLPVLIVEGEKDVETLKQHNAVGTTAMSGASQPWLAQFSEQLAGLDLIVVADADLAGKARARRVATAVEPYARSVRIVIPRYGKDIADHLLAGYPIEMLDPLPAESAVVSYEMASVAQQEISWAWDGWLPHGMLSIIEGDPGEGKSMLTVDLAARWSTGMPMPDGTPNSYNGGVNVGMASAEDDVARVIKPRLIAAGGNPRKVFYLAGMPGIGNYTRTLDLETDAEAIRETIEMLKLSILFFDPLMAYLGSTRTAIDNEVRRVLAPLRYIAEETSCSIIAVRHLRKSGGKAIHAGGGSIAFTGQARAVLVVGRNPNDEAQRIVAIAKSNLGSDRKGQAYRIESGLLGLGPRVIWEGQSEVAAEDLVNTVATRSEVRAEVIGEVIEQLGIEDLSLIELQKRLHRNGIEVSDKLLRLVLRDVADFTRTTAIGKGSDVIWRLKSKIGHHVEPTNPQPDDPSAEVPPPHGRSTFPIMGKVERPDLDAPDNGGTSEDVGSEGEPNPQPRSQQAKTSASDDLLVECSICGEVDKIVYWEEISAWRCRHHNPLTYQGEA